MILVELALALAFLGYLLSHEGVGLPFTGDTYTIKAAFSDAAGLKNGDHAQVTVAGVPMGKVSSLSYSDGVAVATLQLDGAARDRIHRGASASIVPRSALMDLTVDVDPGRRTAPALPEDSEIPASRTSSPVASDRVLSVLDADTRAQAQVLIGQLAAGLHGRSGVLASDLQQLAGVVDSGGDVTRALASRRRLLTQFVGQLDTIFGTLGRRDSQLRDAITGAQRTLGVTGSRDAELAAAMRELPSTLDSTSAALRSVDALAGPLQPALTELQPLARRLPAALRAGRRFLPSGQRLIGDVATLSRRAGPGVAALSASLRRLPGATRLLQPTATSTLPILQAVDRNKEGIGQLGDRFSGVFSTNDVNGPILRGLGFFEPFDPADLGFSSGQSPTLARQDTVKALTRVCLHENAVACLVPYLIAGLPKPQIGGLK